MKKVLAALLFAAAGAFPAYAQDSTYGFHVVASATPLSVTNGGRTRTLTAPYRSVVVSNPGSKTAYCTTGAAATTSNQAISAGGWFQYDLAGANQISCITGGSDTTTVNIVQGFGLAAGGGGGSGGSSGGSGTSSNFNATFPTAGTAAGYEYLSSQPSYTSGQMVAPIVTQQGATVVDVQTSNNQLHADIINPPNTDVAGTPTPWGGTTDGSYSDGWMDLRKVGGTSLALGQTTASG